MPISRDPPTPFPLYLLPSLPFRRRRSSAISSTTASTTSPSSSPPSQPTSYLSTTPTSHLHCAKCLAALIPTASIISKGFTGRHGRAYLVSPPSVGSICGTASSASERPKPGDLPNTFLHKAVPRQLVTGAHTVSDVSCRQCGSVLGWKYVEAEEVAQRYKVGKFILETKRVVKGVGWDEGCEESRGGGMDEENEVQFDSQDEDECEDLFEGRWSVEEAVRRRGRRVATTRM